MTLFVWPGNFKIRRKTDAEEFLSMAQDQIVYWHDERKDYEMYLLKGGGTTKPFVGERLKCERGNIFSPYAQVRDAVQTIWTTRKYINAQIFSD